MIKNVIQSILNEVDYNKYMNKWVIKSSICSTCFSIYCSDINNMTKSHISNILAKISLSELDIGIILSNDNLCWHCSDLILIVILIVILIISRNSVRRICLNKIKQKTFVSCEFIFREKQNIVDSLNKGKDKSDRMTLSNVDNLSL